MLASAAPVIVHHANRTRSRHFLVQGASRPWKLWRSSRSKWRVCPPWVILCWR